MEKRSDLSIVIANYNTKDDLENCLLSIYKSEQNISYEVWVVDNNSPDESSEVVERKFPAARLIRNPANLGFSKANNLALKEIKSDFVLLLNPDTIVSDHVFDKTIEFLKKTPEAGMATCKLIKRDGTLDLACRRSFPSSFDGFCRATGLSKLFPKSHLFARYNLTFLDENQVNEVEAINGAFMMVRGVAIRDVGLLDERFFMYMEDLDWCYRFKQKGWKVYYIPEPRVIHLKGSSGKKSSERMIREFFESMKIFCQKNYRPHQYMIHYWFTVAGIKAWKYITLLRNSFNSQKRVTP